MLGLWAKHRKPTSGNQLPIFLGPKALGSGQNLVIYVVG